MLGAPIDDAIERATISRLEEPPKIFGDDLGWDIFDVFAAIPCDRLRDVGGECVEESQRMD